MNQGRPRYRLSREEIGILLSYARHPEAATEGWVGRLQRGVDGEELAEFVEAAGLPRDSVERIVATRLLDDRGSGDGWSHRSPRFRRAIVGVVVAYVVLAIAFSFATNDPLQSMMLTVSFAIAGLFVYELIVRLSQRRGT